MTSQFNFGPMSEPNYLQLTPVIKRKEPKHPTIEDQINYLVNQEIEKLISSSATIDLRYTIEKFLDQAKEPPAAFVKNHADYDYYIMKSERLKRIIEGDKFDEDDEDYEIEIPVMTSEPKILKLAFYAVLDFLLETFPNSEDLSPSAFNKIVDRDEHLSHITTSHYDGKKDLPLVKIYWSKVPPETQELLAKRFDYLVFQILEKLNVEEVYRLMSLSRELFPRYSNVVVFLVNELYLKLASKRESNLQQFPNELTHLVGSYITRY